MNIREYVNNNFSTKFSLPVNPLLKKDITQICDMIKENFIIPDYLNEDLEKRVRLAVLNTALYDKFAKSSYAELVDVADMLDIVYLPGIKYKDKIGDENK